MKFVVYGEERRLGLVEGERVLDLGRGGHARALAKGRATSQDQITLESLIGLIEAGERGLDLVRETADWARNGTEAGLYSELSQVRLHAPWPGQRLLMAGANSAKHVADCFTNMGTPMTEEEVHEKTRKGPPSAFWAIARPVMGPDARIEIPSRANGLFDYEGEPAVVFGKRGKDIRAKDFKDYVWGVTLVADWSVRDETWPPAPVGPLVFAKNFDCSKSIGPCIVVGEIDPDDFRVQTLVNNELRQDFCTKDMIFSFGEVLEYASQDLSFLPGDVMTLGTGAGTAMDTTRPSKGGGLPRDRFLKPGDRVEIRTPAIGSLIGNIVAKS